ncbi:chemotaxis protein CheW [Desulfonema ishimotonii]|nr:chemotaxis protein CheW [Desulfonema ishimotonii]
MKKTKQIRQSRSVIPLEELMADIDSGLTKEAGPPATDTPPQTASGSLQHIRFTLGDILMAIPLNTALEIGSHPRITPLPNLPGWVPGVTNIRGEIVSMADLKAFFGLSSPLLKQNRRFIVIHNPTMKVGIMVDRIIGIFSQSPVTTEIRSHLYRKTDTETMKWSAYVSEVIPLDEGLLNVLDVEKLLASPRMNAFKAE